jgi:hypothetical protein
VFCNPDAPEDGYGLHATPPDLIFVSKERIFAREVGGQGRRRGSKSVLDRSPNRIELENRCQYSASHARVNRVFCTRKDSIQDAANSLKNRTLPASLDELETLRSRGGNRALT